MLALKLKQRSLNVAMDVMCSKRGRRGGHVRSFNEVALALKRQLQSMTRASATLDLDMQLQISTCTSSLSDTQFEIRESLVGALAMPQFMLSHVGF
jgi:hypothetical protein